MAADRIQSAVALGHGVEVARHGMAVGQHFPGAEMNVAPEARALPAVEQRAAEAAEGIKVFASHRHLGAAARQVELLRCTLPRPERAGRAHYGALVAAQQIM